MKLSITPPGDDGPQLSSSYRVALDGQDIGLGLRTLNLDLTPHRMPRVVLDVVLRSGMDGFDVDTTDFDVPPETRALLIKLGWTPPQEGS